MTQTAWVDVVDRIVTKLNEIDDIGHVHNRMRMVKDAPSFKAISTVAVGEREVARMWMVHLTHLDANIITSGGDTHWVRRLVVEGFLQLDDERESELSTIALIEQVIRKLTAESRNRLGNLVHDSKAPTLEANEPRIFGFVTCHYVSVSLEVVSIETA